MGGSSHAISVSIDTNCLVDQHSFQRAPSGVPHGEFSRHYIPGPEGSTMDHGMAPVGHRKIGKWIRKT